MLRSPSIVGLALASLLFARLAAAEFKGSLTGSLAPGVDTNPRRTVGEDSPTDGFVSLTGGARGRLTFGESQSLAGRYDLGLKKFLAQASEDVAVNQADLDWSMRSGALLLGVAGSAKLRLSRAGTRDYLDGSLDAFSEWAVSRPFSFRLAAGLRRFNYPPDPAYGSLGPQAALSARWAPIRRHALSVGLTGALPSYAGRARLESGAYAQTPRADRQAGAFAGYSFRGPVAAQAGWGWAMTESNSFGESTRRHRLSAALSTPFPPGLFWMLQANWQFIRYPDGLLLSENLLLLDDEAHSSIAAKLVWPIGPSLDLEARWTIHWIELPPRAGVEGEVAVGYRRQTAALGVAARW